MNHRIGYEDGSDRARMRLARGKGLKPFVWVEGSEGG